MTNTPPTPIAFRGVPIVEDPIPQDPTVAQMLLQLKQQILELRELLQSDPRLRSGQLTKANAATYMNVGQRTIDRWRFDEKDPLPYVRKGNMIFFLREDLDAWSKRHRTPRKP